MFLNFKALRFFSTLKSYSGTWPVASAPYVAMKLNFRELLRFKNEFMEILSHLKILALI